MPDQLHTTHTSIYKPETWRFATAAAREAGTGYTISYDDIGKLALQQDLGGYWRLEAVDTVGLTWVPLFGQGGGYWEPVANGDPATPEVVFSDGDIVMTWISPA